MYIICFLFDIILLFYISFFFVCNVGMYWCIIDIYRYNNFLDFFVYDIILG